MDPAPRRRRRFRTVSIFWLLPNVLTVAGLITGKCQSACQSACPQPCEWGCQ